MNKNYSSKLWSHRSIGTLFQTSLFVLFTLPNPRPSFCSWSSLPLLKRWIKLTRAWPQSHITITKERISHVIFVFYLNSSTHYVRKITIPGSYNNIYHKRPHTHIQGKTWNWFLETTNIKSTATFHTRYRTMQWNVGRRCVKNLSTGQYFVWDQWNMMVL